MQFQLAVVVWHLEKVLGWAWFKAIVSYFWTLSKKIKTVIIQRAVPICFLSSITPSCQCGNVTDVRQMVMIQEVQRFEIKLLSTFLPGRLVIIRGKLQSCDPNQLQWPSVSASHWSILTSASLSSLVSGANFESEIGLLKAPEVTCASIPASVKRCETQEDVITHVSYSLRRHRDKKKKRKKDAGTF